MGVARSQTHKRWSFTGPLLLAAAAVVSLPACTARAATIFQDNFDRTGNLVGSKPDVDPSNATWVASTVGATATQTGTTNGTSALISANNTGADGNFVLPFTPAASGVLTLTTNITYGGQGSWAAVGFTASGTATDIISGGVGWMILGSDTQAFGGPGTSNQVTSVVNGTTSVPATGSTYTYRISFDPSNGQYTFAYAAGADQTSGFTTFGTSATGLSTPNGVVLAARRNTTTADSFGNLSLVQAPEPTSVSLIGVAAAGLLARRRRKA